jgi:dsRNA-specific ribonuclease
MTDFKKFITDLFRRGNVKEKHIELFVDDDAMKEFTVAFTHPSAGHERNYENYELLGDVVINKFVVFYIIQRFERIKSIKWITRIKHNLISKKFLASLARKEGIDRFAIFGDKPFSCSEGRSLGMIQEVEKNPDLNKNMFYLSMLEDIMEAFFGCITILLTQKHKKSHGVVSEICDNILKSFFDPVKISIEYMDVFDPVSRIKELYESNTKELKWPNAEAYHCSKIGEENEVIVYGWPKNDKKPVPQNRIELGRARSINKKDAKEEAAAKALKVLEKRWGITECIPNAFEK